MKFAVAAAVLMLSAALPCLAQPSDTPPPPPSAAPAGDAGNLMDALRGWCKQNRGACKPLRVDHEAAQSACQGQPSAPDQWNDACRAARIKVKGDVDALRQAGAPIPAGPAMKPQG
jgi:hypothetical protein